MLSDYLPLLIILMIVAALLRDDFAVTLIYLLAGAVGLGFWWSNRSLNQVRFNREFENRAFLDEDVTIKLKLENRSWLPVLWLRLRDGLPVDLSGPKSFQQVINLGPFDQAEFAYQVHARKRGYYPIGPLFIFSGDILGFAGDRLQRQGEIEYLTVFPKIVALPGLALPSRSPMGSLRHAQPVFEDPSRVRGKRDYVAGDSLRRVDWKSTAATGRMQVKLFEPSIALETMIFLDLDNDSYHSRFRIDATELAIIIAASVANWVTSKKQTVGISVNGFDPLGVDQQPQDFLPNKGQGHLIRILELLARVEMVDDAPFAAALQKRRVNLSWGTTLIIITGKVDDDLLDVLHQAQRAGQTPLVILAGRVPGAQDTQHRASFFGIPVVLIAQEQDLRAWG